MVVSCSAIEVAILTSVTSLFLILISFVLMKGKYKLKHKRLIERMKIYYVILVLIMIPMMSIYAIPETNITFTSIYLMIFLGIIVFFNVLYPVIMVDGIYLAFFIYILIQSLMVVIIHDNINISGLFMSVGQYLLYVFLLCFYNRFFFDKKIFEKWIVSLGIITTVYLLFQQILSTFCRINLGAGFPFLPIINEGLRTYGISALNFGNTYRPRSLFSEPAMYSIFTILVLVICLFTSRYKGLRSYILPFLLSLGILISKSSMGVLSLLLVWSIYLVEDLKKLSNKKIIKLLSALVLVLPVLLLFLQNSSVQFQLNRFTKQDFFKNEPRFSLFFNWDALDLSSVYKVLFGHDFNLTTYKYPDIFLTSFFRQLYCFGVVGLLVLIILLICLYVRSDKLQRIILILFIFQMLGSEIIHGGYILMYFVWLAKPLKFRAVSNIDVDTG